MPKKFLSAALTLALAFTATSVVRAADIDDVRAAVKKLADAANYSWNTTGGTNANFLPGDYKTAKDGFTTIVVQSNGKTFDVVLSNNLPVVSGGGVVKAGDAWKSYGELHSALMMNGQATPELDALERVYEFKTLTDRAAALLERATNVKKADDVYTADLSTESASIYLRDGKGTCKIWVKDGAMTKLEIHVTKPGNGPASQPADKTITVTIKDIGTTKMSVPDEAKKTMLAGIPTSTKPSGATRP